MATPQELAILNRRNLRSYVSPGLTVAPPDNQPPPSLANSSAVNAAYQKLMSYTADSDSQRGILSRNLSTNQDLSKVNRGRATLNSRQNLSDRGMLNSGIALGKDADLNQQYDTLDNQLLGNYTDALGGIDRQKNSLLQQYQDSQIQASHDWEQQQADAAAAQLQAQNEATAQQAQYDQLLAILQGATQPAAPEPIYNAEPIITPIATAAKTVLAKKKAPVVKSPIPKLTLKGPK